MKLVEYLLARLYHSFARGRCGFLSSLADDLRHRNAMLASLNYGIQPSGVMSNVEKH